MRDGLSKREFLKFVPAVTVAVSVSDAYAVAPDPSLYDALIGKQYFGPIRLQLLSGQYLGGDLTMTSNSDVWNLESGEYQGKLHGQFVDYKGYWVFNPDGQRCWQLGVQDGNHLNYWNQNGKATGNPQDWEIFEFVAINKNYGTVKARNTEYGSYINLIGNRFQCSGNANTATVFAIQFAQGVPVTPFKRR